MELRRRVRKRLFRARGVHWRDSELPEIRSIDEVFVRNFGFLRRAHPEDFVPIKVNAETAAKNPHGILRRANLLGARALKSVVLDPDWYRRLREAARRLLRAEANACSLWTDDLIDASVLKILSQGKTPPSSLSDIVGIIVSEMERSLIDYWRSKKAQKRSPLGERITLDQLWRQSDDEPTPQRALEIFAELEGIDAAAGEASRLFWLHEFETDEIAAKLECSERAVRSHLAFGRAWIYERLTGTT